MGVLGALVNNEPIVKIKPVKMMSMRGKPALEKIWEPEVKKLKAFLLGLIVSDM